MIRKPHWLCTWHHTQEFCNYMTVMIHCKQGFETFLLEEALLLQWLLTYLGYRPYSASGESIDFEIIYTWVWVSVLSPTNCLTVDKLFNYSVAQFLHLQNEASVFCACFEDMLNTEHYTLWHSAWHILSINKWLLFWSFLSCWFLMFLVMSLNFFS